MEVFGIISIHSKQNYDTGLLNATGINFFGILEKQNPHLTSMLWKLKLMHYFNFCI